MPVRLHGRSLRHEGAAARRFHQSQEMRSSRGASSALMSRPVPSDVPARRVPIPSSASHGGHSHTCSVAKGASNAAKTLSFRPQLAVPVGMLTAELMDEEVLSRKAMSSLFSCPFCGHACPAVCLPLFGDVVHDAFDLGLRYRMDSVRRRVPA